MRLQPGLLHRRQRLRRMRCQQLSFPLSQKQGFTPRSIPALMPLVYNTSTARAQPQGSEETKCPRSSEGEYKTYT